MRVEILSQDKEIFKGEIKSITLPGKKGQFQILENHAPLFAILEKGEITLDRKKKIPISSGIVHFWNNEIIILVKTYKFE
jgi:F-type H+-transporting ATPase subunit epsilon